MIAFNFKNKEEIHFAIFITKVCLEGCKVIASNLIIRNFDSFVNLTTTTNQNDPLKFSYTSYSFHYCGHSPGHPEIDTFEFYHHAFQTLPEFYVSPIFLFGSCQCRRLASAPKERALHHVNSNLFFVPVVIRSTLLVHV